MTGSALRGTVSFRPTGWIQGGRFGRVKGSGFSRGRRLADDGKRLCETSRRGTLYFDCFCSRSLYRVGGPEEGRVAGSAGAEGWRMTGSAFSALDVDYCGGND